jgi:hypothetical protein
MVRGHDLWSYDSPETEAVKAHQRAVTQAWHAYNQMERATSAVREAMDNPDVGPEWEGQLRAVALRAGALAVGQEV